MMQNEYNEAPRKGKKRQPNKTQGNYNYNNNYNNQYQQPYQQTAHMNARNQGRLDVAGAWILMEGYQALTTKGKRRVVPLLGLALVTVGTMKVAQWSGRTLASGVRKTREYLGRGKTDEGYKGFEEVATPTPQTVEQAVPVQSNPVATVRQDVDMTGSDVQPKPFSHKLLERLTVEEGVFFKIVSNDKKPTREKDGSVNPNYATTLKIGLDGGEYITVENNGLYDKQGNLLIQGGALETAMALLNQYDGKYEKGLLVIIDEFIKEGKIV